MLFSFAGAKRTLARPPFSPDSEDMVEASTNRYFKCEMCKVRGQERGTPGVSGKR